MAFFNFDGLCYCPSLSFFGLHVNIVSLSQSRLSWFRYFISFCFILFSYYFNPSHASDAYIVLLINEYV